MKLVIVESPAKAKTIEKFLGKGYKVIASKGHLRDLNPYRLSIKIEEQDNNSYKFIPTYMITKDHKEIAKEIKDLAKKSDIVYIATDDDREGEAIGWHITHILKGKVEDYPRIVFHEITKSAIQHAIEHPRTIDINKVNAQQARRLLDRIVGYKLSPLLATKIQKGLSAGRVQSAVLNLIVKREEEIKNFNKKEYWSIHGIFKETDKGNLVKYNNKSLSKMSIKNKEESDKIINSIKDKTFTVTDVTDKDSISKPLPPFTTSTLQQVASSYLGYNTNRTMRIAQKLYEGVDTPIGRVGIITYMRTDSVNIAKEAQQKALEYISKTYGKDYTQPHVFTKKATNAQEAHEAIRPTHIELTPEDMQKYLTKEELKLYELIYKRFLATQMKDSIFKITTVTFTNDGTGSVFKLKGKVLKFDGWRKVYNYLSDKNEIIKEYKKDEKLQPNKVYGEQHFTEPPARYTEATLVKEMEKLGIGRPSTYASTITLLKNRNYVVSENKKLLPTENAFKVIKVLREHFPDIVDSNFTASMENLLDKISTGDIEWQQVLSNFYKPFKESIDKGYKEIESMKVIEDTGKKCPKCDGRLIIRQGKYGKFIGCENYPKCKYIEQTAQEPEYLEGYKCPKCGGKIVVKHYKGRKFYGCSNYPKCRYTASSIKKLDQLGAKIEDK